MRSIAPGIRHFLTDQQTLRRWLPAAAAVIVMGIVALGASLSQAQLENAVNWDRHTYDVLLTAQALFNQHRHCGTIRPSSRRAHVKLPPTADARCGSGPAASFHWPGRENPTRANGLSSARTVLASAARWWSRP
jgi:hypothetical protein